MRLFARLRAGCSAALVIAGAIGCAGGITSRPPRHCVTEEELPQGVLEALDAERLDAAERGIYPVWLNRADTLEARCYGINAYRRALGVE